MNEEPAWKDYDNRGRKLGACFYCGNKEVNETEFTWSLSLYRCKNGYGCRTVEIPNWAD